MKRFIHFFSLATLTQLILMLGQLLLLPLQIRFWGAAETAQWYAALAVATATYFVDCGLRTAAHSELLKATADPSTSPDELFHFQQVWSWIRVLVLVMSILLIGADFLKGELLHWGVFAGWHALLIFGCALETLLVIRIIYFDTLGRYRGAEATYFTFAALRLCLSVVALFVFHLGASALALIYFLSAVASLLIQEAWLCRTAVLLRLSAPVTRLEWSVLFLARYTIAEPVANWARLSLPVLIIDQISAPLTVTTYVALRSVFGAGRTTIQQLSRVASVEAIKAEARQQPQRATGLLRLFVLIAICFGSALALFVMIDNLRLLGVWLKHADRSTFQEFALAFALTAPFFCYQIPVNLLFRTGQLATVALKHYKFIAFSLFFAVITIFVRSLPIYLCMLVAAEIMLSISIFIQGTSRSTGAMPDGKMAVRNATFASLALLGAWCFVRMNLGGFFNGVGFGPIGVSAAVFSLLALGMLAGIYFSQSAAVFRMRIQTSDVPDLPSIID